jgi:hypothetical protein
MQSMVEMCAAKLRVTLPSNKKKQKKDDSSNQKENPKKSMINDSDMIWLIDSYLIGKSRSNWELNDSNFVIGKKLNDVLTLKEAKEQEEEESDLDGDELAEGVEVYKLMKCSIPIVIIPSS